MKLKVRVKKVEERFVASCVSLPGCSINVATHEEIEPSIRDAIEGYMRSMDSSQAYEIDIDEK